MSNVKKIIGKLKIKKIMTWTLMLLNRSVATINATLQFLDIYRFGDLGMALECFYLMVFTS